MRPQHFSVHIRLFIMYLASGKLISTHNKVLKLSFSIFFNCASRRNKLRQKKTNK